MRRGLVTAVLLLLTAGTGAGSVEPAHDDCRIRLCDTQPEGYTARDVEAEMQVGREVAARVLARLPLSDDVELRRYVSLVGQALALFAERSELEYHFAVVESDTVNAYSTPGGYIFVTRAAVDAMENEAELAGVLAHEISHVCARHVVEELNIRGSPSDVLGGVVSILSAGSGSATVAFRQAVSGTMDILFEQGYRIEDELEADRGAVFLTSSAGYDASALAGFLERLHRESEEHMSSTAYPTARERVAEILRGAGPEHGGDSPKLLAERFAAYAGTP